MTKRTLTILIVAVVFAAGAAVAIASIGGEDSGAMPTTPHRMDDGEMMNMDR